MERYDISREEYYTFVWKRIKRILELKPELLLNSADEESPQWVFYFGDAMSPISLHQFVFVKSIRVFASQAQQDKWLDSARKLNIIGCYAQTELGHGSNVADLETTATLDLKTDEFVIHSPTVKSAKFWPGSLGFGTHAVVFARLKIEDNDYGVWPFMVQLRSLEDHKPMPGVEVGDIGNKIGFNASDHGFALFTNVRIPRTNLLSRLIDVDPDGSVSLKGDHRLVY